MSARTCFILNDQLVETELPEGTPVLDLLRSELRLSGTKEGCREGDCGACVVLVGSFDDGRLIYQALTSCLLPLGHLAGRHLVTIEGLGGEQLTTVQQAIVDEGATQCGFCTPGIVLALTGFLLSSDQLDEALAVTAVEGNICRCTGYTSIRRAITSLCGEPGRRIEAAEDRLAALVDEQIVPAYFTTIATQLEAIAGARPAPESVNPEGLVVAGGTDLYVQRLGELSGARPTLIMDRGLSGIRDHGDLIELGATTTHEEIRQSPVIRELIPEIERFTNLVSSQPIRERATLAGNVVNASPIGDLTMMLLALGTEVVISGPKERRRLPLKNFFHGYKDIDLEPGELLESFRFPVPARPLLFNFEKVSKRTHLDIASVNSALCLVMESNRIVNAHLAAGGVAPIPLYLEKASRFLEGREVDADTVTAAAAVADTEISPISDVRGSASYKRLLLRQLIFAHFEELSSLGEELVGGVAP